MDFSYELKIGGKKFDTYGKVRILQDANGFGISGVCTSELTVTVTAEEYKYSTVLPNDTVTFEQVDNPIRFAPTFYIASRSMRGGTVSFKCFDRMIFIDQQFITEESFFTDGYADGKAIVGKIANQCGFTDWGVAGLDSSEVPDIALSEEYVTGKTCRALLEALSQAWCGYFKVNHDDVLLFMPFGGLYHIGSKAISHTAIIEGSVKGPIEQVIMSNGEDTFIAGSEGADIFMTLKISSEFASQELANFIMKRVQGYIYQAWECDKAIIDYGLGNAEIDAEITFADGVSRIANHMVKVPSSAGIIISCGRNDVTENEFDYTGALSRDITRRIADCEKLGNNTMITRYQGLVHIGEESKTRSGESTPKKYGYAPATADGVVEFDGAMVSNVIFDSAEKVDDKTVVITYPGNVQYKFTAVQEGGKVTMKKERVKEDTANG